MSRNFGIPVHPAEQAARDAACWTGDPRLPEPAVEPLPRRVTITLMLFISALLWWGIIALCFMAVP